MSSMVTRRRLEDDAEWTDSELAVPYVCQTS